MAVMDENAMYEKWQQLSPTIDSLMERVGVAGGFPVDPSSSLAGDDDRSDPYQVSHVIKMCIGAGVDHLHAAKVLVVDHDVLHVAAPSSLARGALENFAAAYWILGPKNRNERILRTLRWHAKNFKDGETAVAPLGLPGGTPLNDKLKKLDAVAQSQKINGPVRSGYTSTEVVTFAEAEAGHIPLGVVLPWRLCSGFAHGRPWAYLGVSDTKKSGDGTSDLVDVELTNSFGKALFPNLAALQLLMELLRLYEVRSKNHLVELSN